MSRVLVINKWTGQAEEVDIGDAIDPLEAYEFMRTDVPLTQIVADALRAWGTFLHEKDPTVRKLVELRRGQHAELPETMEENGHG